MEVRDELQAPDALYLEKGWVGQSGGCKEDAPARNQSDWSLCAYRWNGTRKWKRRNGSWTEIACGIEELLYNEELIQE
jgi:hypothetical protein